MDSLIVLRKPLRGTNSVAKLKFPKKLKKVTTLNIQAIPSEPELKSVERGPTISFVKLYKELCMEKRARACARAVRPVPPGNTPDKQRSDVSIVTHCGGDSYVPAPGPARAELVLELDYRTSFEDYIFA